MTALLIDLPSVYAGALQQFTIPCAGLLASGETIASVTAESMPPLSSTHVDFWPRRSKKNLPVIAMRLPEGY